MSEAEDLSVFSEEIQDFFNQTQNSSNISQNFENFEVKETETLSSFDLEEQNHEIASCDIVEEEPCGQKFSETGSKLERIDDLQTQKDIFDLIEKIFPKKRLDFMIVDEDLISKKDSDNRIIGFLSILPAIFFLVIFYQIFYCHLHGQKPNILVLDYQPVRKFCKLVSCPLEGIFKNAIWWSNYMTKM